MISGYAPADPNRAARLPASAAATWLRMDYGWLINTLPNLNKMQSTRHNMYVYIYIIVSSCLLLVRTLFGRCFMSDSICWSASYP